KKTFEVLDCYCQTSTSKLPESVYLAYRHLYNLSRRSRYLCSEAEPPDLSQPDHTFAKHLQRSVRHLNTLIDYVEENYKHKFEPVDLDLIEIQGIPNLKYFKHVKKAA